MLSNDIQSIMTKRLLLILSLKALLMIAVIFYAGIELGPDEAQYWTWSQALDWGYYSKPPGIAWQIWLGTQLFGQTEWGVRSLTVLISFLQSYAVYLLALRAGLLPRTAFWCGLFMAFSPLGFLGSLFAITDVGFLFCWTGACLIVVSNLQRKETPDPLLVAGWIAAGALFKWPIYLFWFFYFMSYLWYFPELKKGKLLAAFLLSLGGLLPSLWWNGSHDWGTFRHVLATLQGGSGHKAAGNVGEFLGSQAFLLSPVLFILLIMSFLHWFWQKRSLSPALFFCGFVTFSSLGSVTIAACFQKIQGNWIVFAYPTAMVLLGWVFFQQFPRKAFWAKSGLFFSIFLVALMLTLPSLYHVPQLAVIAPPYRYNPLKHNLGWAMLKKALARQGYDPVNHFLVSDKYQTASLLSFYSKGQKRSYFLNLHGERKNQFSYWPALQDEQKGKEGYFVWTENMPSLKHDWNSKLNFYQNELRRYFEVVDFLELAPLVYEGTAIAKGAFIFRCQECKNLQTPDSHRY